MIDEQEAAWPGSAGKPLLLVSELPCSIQAAANGQTAMSSSHPMAFMEPPPLPVAAGPLTGSHQGSGRV